MEWIKQDDTFVLCECEYQNNHIVGYIPIVGFRPKVDVEKECQSYLTDIGFNYSFQNENYSNPILC